MDFGFYISLFGNGYRSLPNGRRIFPEEKPHHTKQTFCREILCAIVKDENAVLKEGGVEKGASRFLSAFESYYRNNQRRSLRPIAVIVVNKNGFDKEKYKIFLEKYTKCLSKEKLLQKMKENHMESTLDTMFDALTDELVAIIEEAAHEPDHRCEPRISEKQLIPANADDITDVFKKTYNKEMVLSNVNSGIRSEIWKEIDGIINACEHFKSITEKLYVLINDLKKAQNEENQAEFELHFSTYIMKREEVEAAFRDVLKRCFHLHKTFANIKEIKDITQTEFTHELISPPDNKTIYVAGENTNTFIEKLRQLSEDYLYTN